MFMSVYVYRIYQHRDCSIHSHPKLPHRNGKLYNDKSGGIVRSTKAYAVRDLQWTEKYRRASRLASEAGLTAPKDIGQHACNVVEAEHSTIINTFRHHQIYPVYWDYLSMAQVKIIFCINVKKTRTLLKKLSKNRENFNELHAVLISRIDDIHASYLSLSELKDKIDEFGHVYCWWDKLDRTQQTWLKGCSCSSCLKRVSKLSSTDYIMLFYVVYHEMADTDFEMKEIMTNNKKLKIIQRKLSYRMTLQEIKVILYKEWTSKQGLTLDEVFDDMRDEDAEAPFEMPKSAKKGQKERYVSMLSVDAYTCMFMFAYV